MKNLFVILVCIIGATAYMHASDPISCEPQNPQCPTNTTCSKAAGSATAYCLTSEKIAEYTKK